MEEILVDRNENGVVTLTLNRPQVRNAVTYPMWEDLRRVFQEVRHRRRAIACWSLPGRAAPSVPARISRATPDADPRHSLNAMHTVSEAALALHEVSKPTIAKVRGAAVGAGMNLALGCDLIVAGERARFSEIFARRSLSVDFGGTWLLPRLVGLHKAKELAFFGDILSAKEAAELGLVNRVVPDAELDDFVADWANRLAEGPPLALQQSKRMLSNALSLSLSEALAWEASAQTVNLTSKDTREGVRAFLEKRDPIFRGR